MVIIICKKCGTVLEVDGRSLICSTCSRDKLLYEVSFVEIKTPEELFGVDPLGIHSRESCKIETMELSL